MKLISNKEYNRLCKIKNNHLLVIDAIKTASQVGFLIKEFGIEGFRRRYNVSCSISRNYDDCGHLIMSNFKSKGIDFTRLLNSYHSLVPKNYPDVYECLWGSDLDFLFSEDNIVTTSCGEVIFISCSDDALVHLFSKTEYGETLMESYLNGWEFVPYLFHIELRRKPFDFLPNTKPRCSIPLAQE